MAALFGGELLRYDRRAGHLVFRSASGVATQYVYAIANPVLAFLIVRTLPSKDNASIPNNAGQTRPAPHRKDTGVLFGQGW